MSKPTRSVFVEPLEGRTYFDLVPTAVSNPPLQAIGGQHTSAAIVVNLQNTGVAAIHGAYTLTLLVSPDGLLADATPIVTKNEMLTRLNPNATRAISIPVGQFPDVSTGNYQILAEIGGSLAGVGDNLAASSTTVAITAPFIDFSDTIRYIGPTTIATGSLYGLIVTVTNNGNITAHGPLQFQLGTSASGTGSDSVVTAESTRHIFIPASRSENFLFMERVPAATVPGPFFADVTVDPNNTFDDPDTTNNFTVTATSDTARNPYDNILGNAIGSFDIINGPDKGIRGTLTVDVLDEDTTNGDLAGTITDSVGNSFTFEGQITPFGFITLLTNNNATGVTGTLHGIVLHNTLYSGVFRQDNENFATFNLTLPIEPI